jgi:hypothetical protein
MPYVELPDRPRGLMCRFAWWYSRFLIGVTRKIPAGCAVQLARLNGQPGVLIVEDGAVTAALALDIVAGSIVGVRVVVNPDKLAAVNTAAGS